MFMVFEFKFGLWFHFKTAWMKYYIYIRTLPPPFGFELLFFFFPRVSLLNITNDIQGYHVRRFGCSLDCPPRSSNFSTWSLSWIFQPCFCAIFGAILYPVNWKFTSLYYIIHLYLMQSRQGNECKRCCECMRMPLGLKPQWLVTIEILIDAINATKALSGLWRLQSGGGVLLSRSQESEDDKLLSIIYQTL